MLSLGVFLFLPILLFALFQVEESQSKILLRGEACDPKKQGKIRFVSCSILRNLHCSRSQMVCECTDQGRVWDPEGPRPDPSRFTDQFGSVVQKRKNRRLNPLQKIIDADDDDSIKGSCRLKHGETCFEEEDCFTGLNCTMAEDADENDLGKCQ